MVVGLLSEGSVNLTSWIYSVESKARYAQSTQGRFQRWLHNPGINVARLYSPLIQATLAGWQDEVLYLSLDTSCLWNQDCIIRISVVIADELSQLDGELSPITVVVLPDQPIRIYSDG